jgi:acyl transferase domain-containing protein
MERPLHLLTLSARSEDELRQLAGRFKEQLAEQPAQSIADACFAANTGRSHFPYRLAVTAETTAQLRERLEAFATGKRTRGLVTGHAPGQGWPKVAFLFTGQGSQYVNMGRQLYETQPTFRDALECCTGFLHPHLERTLLSVLYPEEGEDSPLDETAYTQPALFALEYALAELWRSWGIAPSIVMGHSVGEYVAACVAGVFSLEDGLKLIALRGRLMQALPRDGAMAAVLADEARVTAAIAPYQEQVSLAAVNGPTNVVISGAAAAVQAAGQRLEAEGAQARPLTVSHAFHSPLMEPICDAFEQAARQVQFKAPHIPLISNLIGLVAGPWQRGEQPEQEATIYPPVLDAGYWRRHIRGPVQFASGMRILAEQGYDVFLEVGPQPVLLGMGRLCLPKEKGTWLPSLRKGQDDWRTLLTSLGALYVEGLPIDWFGFNRDDTRA